MELDEILSAIESYGDGKFPRKALHQAIAKQAEITPALLKALEDATQTIENIGVDYFLHIYALFLLAQFREPKAYPLILNFFSTPGEASLDATGDVVTEDLGRIIASVYDGDLSPLKHLIEDVNVNEYVRAAGLRSLLTLVVENKLSREEVLAYFQELFLTFEEENPFFWTELVIFSLDLCPTEEMVPLLHAAFDQGKVDESFVSRKDINRDFQAGPEVALHRLNNRRLFNFVEDTLTEMGWWACFNQKAPKKVRTTPISFGQLAMTDGDKAQQAKRKKKRQQQAQSRKQNRKKKKKK